MFLPNLFNVRLFTNPSDIPLESGTGTFIAVINKHWNDNKILEIYVSKIGLTDGYHLNIMRESTRVVAIPVHRETAVRGLMCELDPHTIINHNNCIVDIM